MPAACHASTPVNTSQFNYVYHVQTVGIAFFNICLSATLRTMSFVLIDKLHVMLYCGVPFPICFLNTTLVECPKIFPRRNCVILFVIWVLRVQSISDEAMVLY